MFKSKKIALIEENILKNYNKYFRFAFSYVKNKEDAMDVVQEMSYKAIKNASSLKDIEKIDSWIYKIIINECKNLFSKNKIHFENIQDIDIPTLDSYKELDFISMINILDEQEKIIVILRYFEDFKISDISNILSLNENTIKTKLYRSLKKLEGSFKYEA